MKKRVIISTIVSFVLLVAVIAAGINAVFTVSFVNTSFTVYSAEGRAEAEELSERLARFEGKSSTFLDLDDVKSVVEEYPCFRVSEIKKAYPSEIALSVEERKETYAAAVEGGFAVLDEAGAYVYTKPQNENRLGGQNVLLEGFSFSYAARAQAAGDYAEELFSAFGAFQKALGENRANVLRAALERRGAESSTKNDFFYFYMREGVVIRLNNPAERAAEKAEKAIEAYLALTDTERVSGTVDVVDAAAGEEIFVTYTP